MDIEIDDRRENEITGEETGMQGLLLKELVQIRIIVARTTMRLDAVTKLNASSVIELEGKAGREVQVAVNGRVVAWGEVVIVNGNYSVRITRVVMFERRAA